MPNLAPNEDGGTTVIPRPPPTQKYNPGPPPRGSYAGTRGDSNPPKPPPDLFGAYPGPETDAAKQLVQQFLALSGYPTSVDANGLTLYVLGQGLVSNANGAFQALFNLIPMESRQSHPWAAFGLDAATFKNRQESLSSTFEALIGKTGWEGMASQDWMDQGQWVLTGNRDAIQNLYRQAFLGNWSQSQVLSKLQHDPAFAQLLKEQPWLAAGQGEQQIQQQFASLYGSAPVDTNALAGFFRFNAGTQQLGRTARETITSATPQSSTSESR